jgi:hypothetical protein
MSAHLVDSPQLAVNRDVVIACLAHSPTSHLRLNANHARRDRLLLSLLNRSAQHVRWRRIIRLLVNHHVDRVLLVHFPMWRVRSFVRAARPARFKLYLVRRLANHARPVHSSVHLASWYVPFVQLEHSLLAMAHHRVRPVLLDSPRLSLVDHRVMHVQLACTMVNRVNRPAYRAHLAHSAIPLVFLLALHAVPVRIKLCLVNHRARLARSERPHLPSHRHRVLYVVVVHSARSMARPNAHHAVQVMFNLCLVRHRARLVHLVHSSLERLALHALLALWDRPITDRLPAAVHLASLDRMLISHHRMYVSLVQLVAYQRLSAP